MASKQRRPFPTSAFAVGKAFVFGASILALPLVVACSGSSGGGGSGSSSPLNLVAAAVQHSVTVSVPPGTPAVLTTSPASGSHSVTEGQTLTITVNSTPNNGIRNAVGGDCPAGEWHGNEYITGAITGDCTVDFAAGSGLRSIDSGGSHTCAKINNALKCWGNNSYGQLGNDSPDNKSTIPVSVVGFPAGVSVAAVSGGAFHTCAVVTGPGIVTGAAYCWGRNGNGQLGIDPTQFPFVRTPALVISAGVTAISAGKYYTCAVVNGAAQCWGKNDQGQLGVGDLLQKDVPTNVHSLTAGVTAIAAGEAHTCAIVSGRARCWGLNSNRQLGDGTTTNSNVPVPVTAPVNSMVTAIGVGALHSCAVASNRVYCWGRNINGQLGIGNTFNQTTPVAVQNLPATGVTAISVGDNHSCAAFTDGIRCWGVNNKGQLGDRSKDTRESPVQVFEISSLASSLSAGAENTCAILTFSEVKCWGLNDDGQFGNNVQVQENTEPKFVNPLL